jgi:hypothetical protein
VRRRSVLVLGIVLVVAVAGLLLLLWPAAEQAQELVATSGPEKAAIVARKRAARDRGDVDVAPVRVGGRVTRQSDGNGVRGALVLLTPKSFEGGATREPGRTPEPLYARTDAGGGWTLESVKPGRYTLSASARGFLPGIGNDVRVVAGEANDGFDLALVAGGHPVRGVVSDIGGGGIESALVEIVRLDDSNMLKLDRTPVGALTDEDGRYEVMMPDGTYIGSAGHPDYVSRQESFEVAGSERVVDFALTPGAVIEGVVQARGSEEPVAGAVVVASGGAVSGSSFGFTVRGFGEHRVVTDADGRFRLSGLGSGVFELSAAAAGHATRESTEVALGIAETRSDVVVWVEPAFTISGFVVPRDDEESGALEGVWVGALSLRPPGLFVARAPTESDGYFEIPGVQPGNYMVAALGEDTLPNFTGTGAQVEDRDVTDVLVVMDRGVTIRGRVEPPTPASISLQIEADGMGLTGMLSAIGNAFVRGRADAEGNFVLSPVATGKLRIVAEGDDGSKGEIAVEVPAEGLDEVVVQLEPRPKIAGRVVDAHGGPLADVRVVATATTPRADDAMSFSVSGDGMPGGGTPTRDDGSFEITGLDPGPYEIGVQPRKGPPLLWADPANPADPDAPLQVNVEAEGVSRLELRVEALDGVIRGVVLADGEPLPDAWVTAQREGSADAWLQEMQRRHKRSRAAEERREAELPPRAEDERAKEDATEPLQRMHAEEPVLTDARGRFEIPRLRSGTYVIVAEAERGGARARADGVETGSRITLELEPLAGIRGRVDGKVDRFTVAVKGPSPRSKSVFSETGEFTVDRLDPGQYTVEITADNGVGTAEVEVEAGSTSDVEIELEAFATLRGKVLEAGTGKALSGLMVMAHGRDGGFDVSAGLSMLTGGGPRTDASGAFAVGEIRPGRGTVTILDLDASMEGALASAEYDVDPGQTLDLGTITAVAAGDVPMAKRGTLGLSAVVRNWTERPRRTVEGDEEPPSEPDPPADPERERLWVHAIDVGGPAAEAGVEPGDEITIIGTQDVASLGAETARGLLSPSRIEAGSNVTLELHRDGSSVRASITAAPPKLVPG